MRQNICLVGAPGNVGREGANWIANKLHSSTRQHSNPTVVVGMKSRTELAYNPGGFDTETLLRLGSVAHGTRVELSEVMDAQPMDNLDDMLEHFRGEGFGRDLIYVDVTAGKDDMKDFAETVLRDTRSRLATANKNPAGLYDMETYEGLTNDPTRYGYRGTAMAGLGAIPWIRERATIGDNIHEIKASLSGTMGFIFWRLQNGADMSQAIKEAMEAGYTEPDFRDDLNGLDEARKLIILVREAGFDVDMSDVKFDRLLPEEYYEIEDSKECLARIEAEQDQVFRDKFQNAKDSKDPSTFRSISSFKLKEGRPELSVGVEEIGMDDPFAQLRKSSNRIEVTTDVYEEEDPYTLNGPGAGLVHTASVVCVDLLQMQDFVDRRDHRRA